MRSRFLSAVARSSEAFSWSARSDAISGLDTVKSGSPAFTSWPSSTWTAVTRPASGDPTWEARVWSICTRAGTRSAQCDSATTAAPTFRLFHCGASGVSATPLSVIVIPGVPAGGGGASRVNAIASHTETALTSAAMATCIVRRDRERRSRPGGGASKFWMVCISSSPLLIVTDVRRRRARDVGPAGHVRVEAQHAAQLVADGEVLEPEVHQAQEQAGVIAAHEKEIGHADLSLIERLQRRVEDSRRSRQGVGLERGHRALQEALPAEEPREI